MDLELTGKAAIVTGGSVGIGKAVALELAREGVDVAICARGRERLDAAAEEISNETGRRVIGVQADVTDQASVENLAKAAHDAFGRIDILVNNAAFPGGLVRGSLEDADEGPLLEDINTKVMGYFRCAKAAAPYMKQRKWGRIINVGGLSGRRSHVISGLRNAAVAHMAKSLSDDLGPYGITVNLIHPGATWTERSGPMYEDQARREGVTVDEVTSRVASDIAIRRIVDAKEVGYVVAFLCSPKAECITGEIFAVGGGADRAVFM